MNKTKLLLAVLSLMTVPSAYALDDEEIVAQAIQSVDEQVTQTEPTEDSKLNIDPSKYSLLAYSDMLIAGQKYHRLSFAPKSNFRLEPGTIPGMLVFANFFTDGLVGLSVIGWEPYMPTYPKNFPRPDKVKHFMAGYVIGNVSNGVFQIILPDNMRFRQLTASVLGFATATAVGIGKEIMDDRCNCGTPEVADAVATMIGGAVGTLTLSFDIRAPFRPAFKAPF